MSIRYCAQADLLRTIYYAIFDSHLRYGSKIWGQLNSPDINNIKITQNKALWIINFKGPLESADELIKNSMIFNLQETMKIDNCSDVNNGRSSDMSNRFYVAVRHLKIEI